MNTSDVNLSLDDYIMKHRQIKIETKIWHKPPPAKNNYNNNFNNGYKLHQINKFTGNRYYNGNKFNKFKNHNKSNSSQQWRLQPEYRGRFPGMPRLIDSITMKKKPYRNRKELVVSVDNTQFTMQQNGGNSNGNSRFSRRPQMNRNEPIGNRLFTNKHASGQEDDRNHRLRRSKSCEPNLHFTRTEPLARFGVSNRIARNTQNDNAFQSSGYGRNQPWIEDDRRSVHSNASARRSTRSVTLYGDNSRFFQKGYLKNQALDSLERTYNPHKYCAEFVNYNIVPDALPTALHDRFAMYHPNA